MINDKVPELIVVMGVSGSGKSTLATLVAEKLGFIYLDGDSYHSQQAKSLMAAGKPISDEMRSLWVDSVHADLSERGKRHQSIVFAFSGLKAAHRQKFNQLAFTQTQILLVGEKEVIYQRMKNRKGHFANPKLLDSQIASFEVPQQEEQYVEQLPLSQSLNNLVQQVLQLHTRNVQKDKVTHG